MTCLLARYPQDGHAKKDSSKIWFIGPVYSVLHEISCEVKNYHERCINCDVIEDLGHKGKIQSGSAISYPNHTQR